MDLGQYDKQATVCLASHNMESLFYDIFIYINYHSPTVSVGGFGTGSVRKSNKNECIITESLNYHLGSRLCSGTGSDRTKVHVYT